MVLAAFDKLLPKEQLQSFQGQLHPLGNHADIAAYPQTEEQIAAILQYAFENGLKVIPMGGGTKRGFGGTEEKADILLSLSGYRGIVAYSEGDMTITVKPGTTIKEIADFLKQHKQMLPLDPFWPEAATIGGVVAANDSGPKRLKYGSARDHVIGLRVVYPDGRIIRTGGKVVKNVAGYDMNKLFVGSMGTLGVISELTLKLRPLPKHESLVLLRFPGRNLDHLRAFAIQLLDSMMEPVSLELLSPSLHARLNQESGYALAIALEDVEKAVHYQVEWIKSHRPQGTEMTVLSEEEANGWWAEFARIAPNGAAKDGGNGLGLKIGSKNLDSIEAVARLEQLADQYGLYVEAHGGAGHGLSRAYIQGAQEKFIPYIKELRSFIQAKGGYAIVQHASLGIRKQMDVWGEKPSYFTLLEGIKKAVDPRQVLNAKRFVGGI